MEPGKSAQHTAFAAAYDEHVARIYRYHYYRLHNRERAEDLTSQTFLKAWERFDSFDSSKGTVSVWLYRIARNTLIDDVRRLHPSEDLGDAAERIPSGEDVMNNAIAREAMERARALLERLTPEQREVVQLRLWDELSYAEIAEMTGKSESASKMAFSRGLATLRKQAGPLAILLLLIPFIHS
jgi:RNA polymerase sigma-70 factor (ECF subfamily)